MKKISIKHKSNKGFSLVELMLSLIIVSVIAAAFAPVITKKLSSNTISSGFTSATEVTNECSKFGSDCTLCVKASCLVCNLSCVDGQYKDTKMCKCVTCPDGCTTCSSATKCASCSEGYYFNQEKNKCRKYTVSNCAEYSPSTDECVSCNDGYYHNQDDKNCYKYTVENCKTYVATQDLCTTCNTNYYVSDGLCIKQSVSNCKAYVSNENKCSLCNTYYYVKNGSCNRVTSVSNCSAYSTTENKCSACNSGYKLNSAKTACEEDMPTDVFLKIGTQYVTKYNMGDSTTLAIPSSAGVTTVSAGSTCGSKSDYSTKCCWKGTTANQSACNSDNGGYSGCTRTVCNWAAANAICKNYTHGGKTFRLPTTSEMSSWGTTTYSIGLGTSGLMLCDYDSGYSSAYCDYSRSCKGAYGNNCYPYYVWSGTVYTSSDAYRYYLGSGSWRGPYSGSRTRAFSVRCISD